MGLSGCSGLWQGWPQYPAQGLDSGPHGAGAALVMLQIVALTSVAW